MLKNVLLLVVLMLEAINISAQEKKVLFILSSANKIQLNEGKKSHQTGVFLNEFYSAYKAISKAGYSVELATPKGEIASIDEESYKDEYWGNTPKLKDEAIRFIEQDNSFLNPISLEDALSKSHEFYGLVIPGGQGLMVDLYYNNKIPILLNNFASEKKPTGLICHAPSLLLTLPKDDNPYLGYKVNAVTSIEEIYIEMMVMKGKPAKRKIAKMLKKHGFVYQGKRPKADFAMKDRNLITSQNPFSGNSFSTLYLEALSEYENSVSLHKVENTRY